MPRSYNRKTATKVVDGRVSRKNRHVPTGHRGYVIDRESPGRGYRHVVTKRDLQAFIDLIPDWAKFSKRLERIVLGSGHYNLDGRCLFYSREETGAIHLYAWNEEGWVDLDHKYHKTHRGIFERLGVTCDSQENFVTCHFSDSQARAFLLLHVFMHELGHHWDHFNRKHPGDSSGEEYAEHFANRHFDLLFPAYVDVFGHPGQGVE